MFEDGDDLSHFPKVVKKDGSLIQYNDIPDNAKIIEADAPSDFMPHLYNFVNGKFVENKAHLEYLQKEKEKKENEVRAERDRLLAETDWRFRSDLTPSQEWKDYCQALRDLPLQVGFPFDVTYPTKP